MSDHSAELAAIRFRVEVACDGYAALMYTDVPDGWVDDEMDAYKAGAAEAARAIREVLGSARPPYDGCDCPCHRPRR